MTKELEALKRIRQETCTATYMADFDKNECCDVIETALQRLEAIDNANPSEALECLEQFINEMTYCLEHPKEYAKGYERQIFWKYKNTLETTIKQALLKAQENARSEEILQKYYQEGITLDSVRALKQERDNYKKALEIIKKKNVDIRWIEVCDTVKDYNKGRDEHLNYELTEEEFNLLKEVLE